MAATVLWLSLIQQQSGSPTGRLGGPVTGEADHPASRILRRSRRNHLKADWRPQPNERVKKPTHNFQLNLKNQRQIFGRLLLGHGSLHSSGFTESEATMRNVQIGPRNSDRSHHAEPLLPLVCARPALMRDNVNQPTAYSVALFIEFS